LQGKTDTLVLRFASAFAYYGTEEECMKVALRTLFTHGDAKGVAAARYVARIVFRIIHGKATLRMAILRAAEESDLFIRDLVEKGLQVRQLFATITKNSLDLNFVNISDNYFPPLSNSWC
jgi:ADP-ribosylglycohydrolase